MKRKILILLTSMAVALGAQAQTTITQWNFNSEVPDFDTSTGSLNPSTGSAPAAEAIGGVHQEFGSAAGGGSSDPESGDNSQWRLGTQPNTTNGPFPAQGTGNKSAGAQFMASTEGYMNIRFQWDHYNSNTGSRYWRIQYTLDGSEWLDHWVYVNPEATTWHNENTVRFVSIPGANNNPNFGVRLVSEFESTATGSGVEGYVGAQAGGGYGVNGTLWIDMVTFTGDIYDSSVVQPAISSIEDQVTTINTPVPAIPLTVSHPTTPASQLMLSAEIEDFNVVSSVDFGGSGNNRTATLNLAPGTAGESFVTIRVTDPNTGGYNEERFKVTILEPTISAIPDQTVDQNVSVEISFEISNLPGDPSTWTVTGSSSYPPVVPDANIVISGNGAERSATITPAVDEVGDTVITITASSNGVEATRSFNFRVLAATVVGWNFNHLTTSTAVPSVTPTTVALGVSASDITRGPGIRNAGLTRGFSADRWAWDPTVPNPPEGETLDPVYKWEQSRESALLMGEYYEFSITIEEGYVAALSTLNAAYRRSAIASPEFLEWQYSLDGFATPGVTIIPKGAIWESLGWTESYIKYMGRTSGNPPSVPVNPYDWMIMDVAGRPNATTSVGDPMPTMHLTDISELQNLKEGDAVTFRLYAWAGASSTAHTSTFAFGRVDGPVLGGTVMLDPSVMRPTISEIEDRITLVNTPIDPISFVIGHPNVPANDLTLSVEVVSDPNIISSADFGGSGANRTLTLDLAQDISGMAGITIRVTDPNSNWVEESFNVTILTPTASEIVSQVTGPSTPFSAEVSIENLPGDPTSWTFIGNSSNPVLVPDENIVITGTGGERTVTVTPVPDEVGDAIITVSAHSNGAVARTSFRVRVRPPVVVQFNLTGVPSSVNAVALPTTIASGVTGTEITRGAGINAAALANGFSANGWNRDTDDRTRENALETGAYFEFSIGVEEGYTASLSTLNKALRRSSSNSSMHFEWQYSFDGFATPGFTIVPRGSIWDSFEWDQPYFTYWGNNLGFLSSAASLDEGAYNYMYEQVREQDGNPIPMIDLREISDLQNIPEGTQVTFRLYAWGRPQTNTTASNTVALGRHEGPEIGGIVLSLDDLAPSLDVVLVGNDVRISWPVSAEGYVLESTDDLSMPDWATVGAVSVEGSEYVVTISNPAGTSFFRLRK